MPDHTRRLKLYAFAALAFVALSPAPAPAPAQNMRTERVAARAEMEARQRMLWDLEKLNRGRPMRARVARPDHSAVAEEFKQLQLVNYSLAGVADPKAPLDFARVRKESGEVRKRAARLKGYLSLPEVEDGKKRDRAAEIETPEALREAVVRLDGLVNSFVWNPVFQRPNVVDLEQSTKAGRDLAGIITLSEQIRKSAEELSKSLAKK
ncbi:MAG TPA: hypothetical protein VN282_13475 [Pyrinomonadaceae bacterium]|nr:hypothetical protein [Pyrinomonadaceae bacterium]